MNNKELAEKILELIGGAANVDAVTHCVTRLRITIKDKTLPKNKEISSLKGVMGINLVGNQYQVIIGPKVADIYKEFEPLVDKATSQNSKKKKKIGSIIIDTFTGIFTPILPAIIGAGLLKGILIFLMFFELASTDSDLYRLLSVFSDAVYYFLPMLLAVSTATHFKCNKYVALAIAGVLVHPDLVSMMAGEEAIHLFGITVTKASYGSSVLPIILSIWLMSYIERFLAKAVPQILRTILVPLLTILIVAPITLIVIGPIGTIISNGLATNFLAFYQNYGMIAGAIFSGFLPLMILLGIHNGFTPVMVQSLSSFGVDYLMGLNVASNSAQAGATLAVFTKTKNKNFKSLAGTAAFNAIIGITEPALYGITTKLKKPLIAVMIGGSIGGGIAGFFGVTATGMGTGPIAGIPLFLTDTFIYFAISCIVSFIVAFILTLVIGFEDVPSDEYEDENQINFKESKSKDTEIKSPLEGKIIDLENVNDNVFSAKMMGDGIAVLPTSGKVYAPFDGKVVMTFPSGHAVGLVNEDGCEVLIHVGLNTVQLNGEGFTYHINQNDAIKQGDLLMEFDKDMIQEKGYDITTPIIITNTDSYNDIQKTTKQNIKNGQTLIILKGDN